MARDSEDDDENAEDTSRPSDASKDRISTTLKRVYDDVASEPLPDKLVDLLNSLKKKDGGPA